MYSFAATPAATAVASARRSLARSFFSTSARAATAADGTADAQQMNEAAPKTATKKARKSKKATTTTPTQLSANSLPTPIFAATVSRSGSPLQASTLSAQLPPLVADQIAKCKQERAILRAAAPFLTIKPSEWSESKVAEFEAAGANIQARVCVCAP